MNSMQKRAYELWIGNATIENSFLPLSEEALTKRLIAEGYRTSASSVNRWKAKFGWKALLEAKVDAAIVKDDGVRLIVKQSSLETMVKNTVVDIERNDRLLAGSYQGLETVMGRLLKKLEDGAELSKYETDTLIKIAQLSAERKDRMLDRLSNMPRESVSAEEIIAELHKTQTIYEAEYEEIPNETQ